MNTNDTDINAERHSKLKLIVAIVDFRIEIHEWKTHNRRKREVLELKTIIRARLRIAVNDNGGTFRVLVPINTHFKRRETSLARSLHAVEVAH